ncbi:MAG: hypothetical protein H7Z21_20080 [Hymenobacter sp.]|nr:hypothetical protein [Hymenobacter sp.]
MKIISGVLLLVSVFLSVQHGWAGITQTLKPAGAELLAGLGFTKSTLYAFSVYTLAVAALLLFPQTFFLGNLLNAAGFLLLAALALRTGNLRLAATELAVLLLPLALIWLKHPLAK